MNLGGIYEIVNTVNGRRYIGSAVDFKRRWKTHKRLLAKGKHHSIHLQRAWDEDGVANFKFAPLMTEPYFGDLIWWEQRFLDALRPEYNISLAASAPMKGRKHSPKAKDKMSRSGKGKPKSPSHCAAISVGQRGRKMSEIARKALREANVGRALSDEHKDKLRVWNTGKVMSPDAIERSASKRRGVKRGPQSAELIEKRIAPLRGRKRDPEVVARAVAKITKANIRHAIYKRLMEYTWAGA